MVKAAIFALFILFLAWGSDCFAPMTTERDIFGYSTYRFAEDGSIRDDTGAIKGWIHGNTVYDPSWNVRYHIRGNRLYRDDE